MSHQWDRGVMNESSWHGLEEIGVFTDAQSMLAHGYRSGAWPIGLRIDTLTAGGVTFRKERGVIASYQDSEAYPDRDVGVVGNDYCPNPPKDWADLCIAAEAAGAKPTGAFSLYDGRTVIATFEINGRTNGISNQLLLVDSFDGKKSLACGLVSIRVVCANTLARAFRSDGKGMAKLRHLSTLEENVKQLKENIGQAVKTGHSVAELYEHTRNIKLTDEDMAKAINLLVERPTGKDGAEPTDRALTRWKNDQANLRLAMAKAVNNDGGQTLATLLNGATYLVDRKVDGKLRTHGDANPLESLLFGTRGREVDTLNSQIVSMVEMYQRDGSLISLPVSQAAQVSEIAKQDFAGLMGQPSTVV